MLRERCIDALGETAFNSAYRYLKALQEADEAEVRARALGSLGSARAARATRARACAKNRGVCERGLSLSRACRAAQETGFEMGGEAFGGLHDSEEQAQHKLRESSDTSCGRSKQTHGRKPVRSNAG